MADGSVGATARGWRELPWSSFPRWWGLFLGLVSVVLVFTAATLWLYAYRPGVMPLPPIVWLAAVMGGGLVLALFRENWRILWNSPLLAWCAVFLVLTGAGFINAGSRPSAVPELISFVITCACLVSMTLIAADARVYRVVGPLLAVAVLFAIAMNVVDLLYPGTFSNSFGRSAGLYVNPNISGYAIGSGMLAAMRSVPARWRPWFVMTCAGGVLLTLSRGSMLNWGVCTAFLVWRGVLPLRPLIRNGLIFLVFGVGGMVITGRLQAILSTFDITDRAVWERLTISGDAAQVDISLQTRQYVARRALETFAEHPLTGAGLGATTSWEVREDTHNTFLKFLAIFGVLGPLLFLWHAYAVSWRGRGEVLILGQAYAIFTVLHGLFSHNVLDDRPTLVCSAFMAALTTRSALGLEREDETP